MQPVSELLDFDHQGLHFFNRLDQVSTQKSGKTFEYRLETSLKHSNATQNIYFSNYVEWQGAVRERWFFQVVSPDMLQEQGVFVTKSVQQKYLKEAFPFQTIDCRLNSFHIQRCAFWLLFRFFSEEELLSYGCQQVVFTDHDKRITRLPKDIIGKIKQYEWRFDY